MAVSKLLTDSTTENRLGPELLAELRANLWAVDCQTCGGRFGRWEKPALIVQALTSKFRDGPPMESVDRFRAVG